jgi:hypothetical protein
MAYLAFPGHAPFLFPRFHKCQCMCWAWRKNAMGLCGSFFDISRLGEHPFSRFMCYETPCSSQYCSIKLGSLSALFLSPNTMSCKSGDYRDCSTWFNRAVSVTTPKKINHRDSIEFATLSSFLQSLRSHRLSMYSVSVRSAVFWLVVCNCCGYLPHWTTRVYGCTRNYSASSVSNM